MAEKHSVVESNWCIKSTREHIRARAVNASGQTVQADASFPLDGLSSLSGWLSGASAPAPSTDTPARTPGCSPGRSAEASGLWRGLTCQPESELQATPTPSHKGWLQHNRSSGPWGNQGRFLLHHGRDELVLQSRPHRRRSRGDCWW